MRLPDPDPIYTIPSKTRLIGKSLAKKHGITYDQLLILVWFRSVGQATQAEGKEKAGYHNGEVFRQLLTQMVKTGFVGVQEDSKDLNIYYLSKKGDYVIRGYSLLMRRALSGG